MEEEAAILAVGLRLGLAERHEVIAWADQQILATDEPSLRLIDLADMHEAHPLDVYSTLVALASGRSEIDALPAALARYTYRLREEPKLRRVLARAMWGLATEVFFDLPERLSPMIGFEDSYLLAESGTWGTVARADAQLLAFCESFEPGGAPFPAPRNDDEHELFARDANLGSRRRSLFPAALFGVILTLVLLNTGVYSGSDIGRLRWRFEHGRLALRFSELHGGETFYVAANSEPLKFAVEGRWWSSSDWSLVLPLWIPLLLVGGWWVMAWRRPPRPRTASRTSTSHSG